MFVDWINYLTIDQILSDNRRRRWEIILKMANVFTLNRFFYLLVRISMAPQNPQKSSDSWILYTYRQRKQKGIVCV
jgi:hypothetical protein